MDPETIREIIDAVQQLGGEAKGAFIWYLIAAKLPGFLLGAGGLILGGFVACRLLRLLRSFVVGESLRDAAGVEQYWAPHEIQRACEVLRNHYKQK